MWGIKNTLEQFNTACVPIYSFLPSGICQGSCNITAR